MIAQAVVVGLILLLAVPFVLLSLFVDGVL